jgi:hypothetical protein
MVASIIIIRDAPYLSIHLPTSGTKNIPIAAPPMPSSAIVSARKSNSSINTQGP